MRTLLLIPIFIVSIGLSVRAQEETLTAAKSPKYLILGGIAIHPSQTSGFVMLGAVKTLGGYIKAKTDLNLNEDFRYEGKISDIRYYTDDIEKGRYAITGGLLWQTSSPLMVYGGLGYGTRWVNWRTLSGDAYRVANISYKGLELETGLMVKMQKFVFSGGVSITSFNYMEANIGVGILFGKAEPKIKESRTKSAHGGK